ncbi:hypothetical protein [Flavobacterium sp.]
MFQTKTGVNVWCNAIRIPWRKICYKINHRRE